MITTKEIAEIYNRHGENYHRSRARAAGRLFNEFIDIPAVLSLIPDDLSEKRVLDAGCGSGLYAQLLAKRGAKVNGIDASAKMIEIAKLETPQELNIDFVVGDLCQLPYEKESFDLIICTYVLENIGNLSAVFREFNRVLKQSCPFILSISHPIRAYAQKEERNGKEVWLLSDYFQQGLRQSDFGNGMVVPKYIRPIQEYTEALNKANFAIMSLLEPRPILAGKEIDPVNFEKAERLPQILTLCAVKCPVKKDEQSKRLRP